MTKILATRCVLPATTQLSERRAMLADTVFAQISSAPQKRQAPGQKTVTPRSDETVSYIARPTTTN